MSRVLSIVEVVAVLEAVMKSTAIGVDERACRHLQETEDLLSQLGVGFLNQSQALFFL